MAGDSDGERLSRAPELALCGELCVCSAKYMTNMKETYGAQVTFRLSPELDRQMRATSKYFRRSLTEEWRAAAIVYQRVVRLWTTTHSEAARTGKTELELIAELCSGAMLEPLSLEDLRRTLGPASHP
jgi:hypothetical protein